jgi:hypothetical protein
MPSGLRAEARKWRAILGYQSSRGCRNQRQAFSKAPEFSQRGKVPHSEPVNRQ